MDYLNSMDPKVRDYLLKKRQAAIEPSGLQALSNAFASIGAGLTGGNPVQAGLQNQQAFNQQQQAALDEIDKEENRMIQGEKMAREDLRFKREEDLFKAENDPNSEASKIAQQTAIAMGYKGDPSKITAKAFKDFSPALQKKFEIEENRRNKQLDRNLELQKLSGQSSKKEFERLPIEKQEIIKDLSKTNARKIGIANQIEAVMGGWDKLSDDQKLASGRQLLKTLNSPEGADAIGAEEANRLGEKLEFAMGNLTNSNPTRFGRDLPGFAEQARNTAQNIKDAVKLNQAVIDKEYGRNVSIDSPKNAEQTKTINGIKYKKVQGGWEEV